MTLEEAVIPTISTAPLGRDPYNSLMVIVANPRRGCDQNNCSDDSGDDAPGQDDFWGMQDDVVLEPSH